MLFRKEFLEGIRAGAVTLAFRRWRRPSVRAGGSLLTPVGQLSIVAVEPVAINGISAVDAHRAGYESRELLLNALRRQPEGRVYRIELGPLVPDPRVALRETPAETDAESQGLRNRLSRWDSGSPDGAWTFRTLRALSVHPGVRAGDLCGLVGQEKQRFKLNVRKLKSLGLTESLGTGYRLSPRGEALLARGKAHTALPESMAAGKASSAKAAVGDKPVFAYIAGLPEPQRGIVERVDALAAKVLPGLQRSVKWGMAYYGVGDGWCFCCGAFANHVKLMFINGVTLTPVPPVTPVAMGKATRGVELESLDDLDERQVTAWMKQIAASPGVGKKK